MTPGSESPDRDEELIKAMTPVTERSIRRSVELNSAILSDALFPIIGAAVRKAIAHAFAAMMQSLNSAVENSLSPQSMRWRAEAWRTGKSFAEVVAVRTLLFRVEQVFLIEKSSGLLLQHVALDPLQLQDGDLVSGMLTAIQDFVRDSFKTPDNDGIGSVTIGETLLWIETGPMAVLAGVIRGNPPEEVREVFHDTVVAIHQDHLQPLASFRGETEDFSETRELLAGCLRQQGLPAPGATAIAAPKRAITPFHIAAALLLLALAGWGLFTWRDARRWAGFREHLRGQPGIVVYEAEKKHGKYTLAGLRDPLADDPLRDLGAWKIPRKQVLAHWNPFQSLDATIVRRRARAESARLREGIEDTSWVAEAGLSPHAELQLLNVAQAALALERLAGETGEEWLLRVSGPQAEAVADFLYRAGIPPDSLAIVSRGSESGANPETRTHFQVHLKSVNKAQ